MRLDKPRRVLTGVIKHWVVFPVILAALTVLQRQSAVGATGTAEPQPVNCSELRGVAEHGSPARASVVSTPSGFDGINRNVTLVPELTLPELNIDSLVAADLADPGGPVRIGIGVVPPAISAGMGRWIQSDDGLRVWQLRVVVPGALHLRLHLSDVDLPPDAALYFQDNTGAYLDGPYVGRAANGNGVIWTRTTDSDEILISYTEPAVPSTPGGLPFTLTRILSAYQPLAAVLAAVTVAPCNQDVSCFPSWNTTAKSVARVVSYKGAPINAWIVCSGTLLNNSVSDQTPYFLTANHCIANNTEALSAQFIWFYETTSCNGSTLRPTVSSYDASYLAGADASANDFSLLMIRGELPSGVTWAGWTTVDPGGTTELTSIHHPDGGTPPLLLSHKRIAFGNTRPFPPPPPGYYRVAFTLGTVERGSSGGGLWNSKKVIVGHNSGSNIDTNDPCDQDLYYADFGKFSMTYDSIASLMSGGSDDIYEPNTACIDAAAVPKDFAASGLVVKSVDPDWYRIPVASGETLEFVLDGFLDSYGNIDLALYDVCGDTVVAVSQGSGGQETVSYTNGRTDGDVFVKVYLASGTRNTYSASASVTTAIAPPVITHDPLPCQRWGLDVDVCATVEDPDTPAANLGVSLYYRNSPTAPYTQVTMSNTGSLFCGVIPGNLLPCDGRDIEYYITASDKITTVSSPPTASKLPHIFSVCPNQPPVCDVPQDTTIYLCEPAEVCLPVGGSDSDGNLSHCALLSGPGTFSGTTWCYTPLKSQTVTVAIECVDSCGAVCQTSFRVTLDLQSSPPSAECPGDTVVGNDPGTCGAVVIFSASVTDDCPGATITCAPPSGTFFPIGATTVTCIATDAAKNTDTCTFTVTVVDEVPPTVTCSGDIVTVNDAGECGAVVTFGTNGADDCSAVDVVCSPSSGSLFPVGATSVMCVATDSYGNADTCTFTVTVTDNEPPVANCLLDTIVAVDEKNCNSVVEYTLHGDDNCGIDSVICNPLSGSVFGIGPTTVHCTVYDAAGLSASCSFVVTVVDSSGACPVCPLPIPAFAPDAPVSGPVPFDVNFADGSANEPTAWHWDFGDGTQSTDQSPSNTYETPGVYSVSLVAGNVCGDSAIERLGLVTATGFDLEVRYTGQDESGYSYLASIDTVVGPYAAEVVLRGESMTVPCRGAIVPTVGPPTGEPPFTSNLLLATSTDLSTGNYEFRITATDSLRRADTVFVDVSHTGQDIIGLSSDSVDFDEVLVGSSRDTTIMVSNTAPSLFGTTLSIDSARVTGTGFEIISLGNVVLQPGAGTNLIIRYAPGDTGPDAGRIIIDTDNPAFVETTIVLHGRGALPPTVASTDPVGEMIDFLIDRPAQFVFSKALDSASLMGAVSATAAGGGVVAIEFALANFTNLTIRPLGMWPPDDTVTVRIGSEVSDLSGFTLDGNGDGSIGPNDDFAVRFTTSPGVLPGDADLNSRVNEADVLPLARFMWLRGPVRTRHLEGWSLEGTAPWEPRSATHADCDGDGEVNPADICVIAELFDHTRAAKPADRSALTNALRGLDNEVLEALLKGLLACPDSGSPGFAALRVILEPLTEAGTTVPTSYRLHQNYPNPFNASTVIEFELAKRTHVRVEVFNIMGQSVKLLATREFPRGYHLLTWDGTDEHGTPVGSGVYYYRVRAGAILETRSMVLLK